MTSTDLTQRKQLLGSKHGYRKHYVRVALLGCIPVLGAFLVRRHRPMHDVLSMLFFALVALLAIGLCSPFTRSPLMFVLAWCAFIASSVLCAVGLADLRFELDTAIMDGRLSIAVVGKIIIGKSVSLKMLVYCPPLALFGGFVGAVLRAQLEMDAWFILLTIFGGAAIGSLLALIDLSKRA